MSINSIDSDSVIACFDNFIEQLNGKQAVIILDNAPTHTSNKFKDKIDEWKEKGIHIYFIPPYSPNLNTIETLWKFMKYIWFEIETFSSFESLWNYIEKVLKEYGKNEKYVINFG